MPGKRRLPRIVLSAPFWPLLAPQPSKAWKRNRRLRRRDSQKRGPRKPAPADPKSSAAPPPDRSAPALAFARSALSPHAARPGDAGSTAPIAPKRPRIPALGYREFLGRCDCAPPTRLGTAPLLAAAASDTFRTRRRKATAPAANKTSKSGRSADAAGTRTTPLLRSTPRHKRAPRLGTGIAR